MTKWLSEPQQKVWRNWLAASSLLHNQLNSELQESDGLTMADYEILVRLSDSPDRRIRMSDLAEITLSSRSRLTHQIDRMEKAGLVTRQACADDRRGQHCVMTDKGWKTLVAAAPNHVESVRAHFVDILTAEEYAALGKATAKIAAHLAREEQ
jgi:DNA-binding MarR family transcriptional regulator